MTSKITSCKNNLYMNTLFMEKKKEKLDYRKTEKQRTVPG